MVRVHAAGSADCRGTVSAQAAAIDKVFVNKLGTYAGSYSATEAAHAITAVFGG